ncbi:hypothetical protein C8R46DRAFT_1341769 [Mycena filopes]|nr:hypothetical protein C8R46DRAFT_1341769 [Mycena filopes]
MADSLYLIPATGVRLTKQYAMKKTIYGWTSAVPDSIDLSRVQRVTSAPAPAYGRADGVILLEEVDPILRVLTEEQEHLCSPADDVAAKYLTGTTWMHKANCLYTGYALKNHFLVGMPYRLPTILHASGLALSEQADGVAPIGASCRVRTGMRGTSLAPLESISVENMNFIFRYNARALAKRGMLEVPWGSKVVGEESEEVIEGVLEEIRAGMVDEGAVEVCVGMAVEER